VNDTSVRPSTGLYRELRTKSPPTNARGFERHNGTATVGGLNVNAPVRTLGLGTPACSAELRRPATRLIHLSTS